QQSAPADTTPDDGIPAVDGGLPAPRDAQEMTVVDITDGDTIRLRDGSGAVENVRLVGIDTPEVYPEYECFGDEAEAELLRLAPTGSTLLVDPDLDPFDDYDRLLLYLWNDDGTFINLALVEGGFAEAIRVAPNDAWYDELLAAEGAAAEANLGIWRSC
ncbi:MAG TPA: thermonuclease family protein, partial [Pseudolysinimonas sp.]|nr:thermonuclease family protein [Pseudolysinimonas sp.]